MKVNDEMAIELNNELKLNVAEQLQEQCDIDDEDEVQEITAARILMKKNRPVCVTCNPTFAIKKWVEKTYPGRAPRALLKLLWINCSEMERK